MAEYNICYSLDSKYAEQLAVSISSILRNSLDNENIRFYILDGGLTKQDKTNIELLKNIKNFEINYIEINPSEFKNCPLLKDKDNKYKKYHVTLPTYFRFKLASIFDKSDKILYLDCDVIINKSLKTLYETNIKDTAALMVLDAESKREAERLNLEKYCNAGVMLINLDYWRKNNVEQRLFDYAKNNADKILWQDQDVINAVLENEIKTIDNKWNFQYFQYENIDIEKLPKIGIFHLAGRFKPWLMAFEHPLYDLYYFYLAKTAWRNKIIKYKENASGKTLKNNIGGNITNILVNATDEDIQKIYSEINKIYELKSDLTSQTDEKVSKVYDEISKNYDYTNQLSNELKSSIIDSEQRSNDSINSLKSDLTSQTDEKVSKVYDEISKNYDYTNQLSNELKSSIIDSEQRSIDSINALKSDLNAQSDEKVSKVYDEISKNYDYTNQLSDELKSSIIDSEQRSIGSINSLKSDLTSQTDEKVSKVYDEISKNYDYTNKLSNELKSSIIDSEQRSIGSINSLKSDLTSQTDEKVSKVYDEISKNYKYTEELVNKAENNTKANINEIQTMKFDISNKAKDLYIYMNEQFTGLFSEFNESHKLLNDKIENKSIENNKKLESAVENTKVFNQELKNNTESAINTFNEKLQTIENQYKQHISELQNTFNEQLNSQRVKYEKKLSDLENIIAAFENKYELKKESIFDKLKKSMKK